jgi:hypothetical protein
VTIEKDIPFAPMDNWVATHQLIKYLPVLFIVITPVPAL